MILFSKIVDSAPTLYNLFWNMHIHCCSTVLTILFIPQKDKLIIIAKLITVQQDTFEKECLLENTYRYCMRAVKSYDFWIEASVVDLDPYWIRIQELSGSVFQIRIRIHTCKYRIKWRLKRCKILRYKFTIQRLNWVKISLGDILFL